jgi:adenylate cyclase
VLFGILDIILDMAQEIEHKFLVEAPRDLSKVSQSSQIEQTYLVPPAGCELRVRKSVKNGQTTYTKTLKRPTAIKGVREEIEDKISEKQYLAELENADPACQTIQKIRHVFIENGQKWELDQYQGAHEGLWTLEAEVADINAALQMPDWIKIQREVTGEKEFSNANLALRNPPLNLEI